MLVKEILGISWCILKSIKMSYKIIFVIPSRQMSDSG